LKFSTLENIDSELNGFTHCSAHSAFVASVVHSVHCASLSTCAKCYVVMLTQSLQLVTLNTSP